MLLEVEDLKVSFHSRDGVNEAVKGISFGLDEGKTLAIVGESGSGKSVTSMALTKLLPPPPLCQVSGEAMLDGKSLLDLSDKAMRSVRGKQIAYIFQEPSTSLNPYYTVGSQIAEALKYHRDDVEDVWVEGDQAARPGGDSRSGETGQGLSASDEWRNEAAGDDRDRAGL